MTAHERTLTLGSASPRYLGRRTTLVFRTFHGAAGLSSIRAEWNAVVAAMSFARHIHHFAWLDAYAHHLAVDPAALRFTVAYRNGVPVGVFPLVSGARTIGGVSVRTLELPEHSHLSLGDFVFARRPENAGLVASLMIHLQCESDSWDVLMAPSVLEDSSFLFSINARRPANVFVEQATPCHFLDNTPYDARLSGLTKNFRHGLRKARTALARQKRVDFARVTDVAALPAAFGEFMDVESSGWKGHDGTAVRSDARLIAFYRSLIDGFAESSTVEINLLRVAGRCIAAQFCLRADRCLYILKIGYREEESRLSPGNMLFDHVVKGALATGEIDEVNLISDAAWHDHWGPQAHRRFTAYVFNQTVRGRISHGALVTKERLRPAYHRYVKPFLERTGRVVTADKN